MWQTKYSLAVPKNLGVGVNFGRAVKAISSMGVRSPSDKKNCSLNYEFGTFQAHAAPQLPALQTLEVPLDGANAADS